MEERLWKILLRMADQASEFGEEIDFCCFHPDDTNSISINHIPKNITAENLVCVQCNTAMENSSFGAVINLDGICGIKVKSNQLFSTAEITFLKIYLPYCFLAQLANRRKRAVTVAHFAQSLDGKIATKTGDSQWIGNEENLIHAHRMRALCDSIIIGKNTLIHDAPKLTVRRVEGANPKRVVIASPENDFSSLRECCDDPILVIGKEPSTQNGQINYHRLDAVNGKIESDDILKCLYQQGLKTVYIEGGSITTSNFLQDKAIDVLQLHFSPYLFGSGKQGIELLEIEKVEESIQFDNFSFITISDSIMFVGQPN